MKQSQFYLFKCLQTIFIAPKLSWLRLHSPEHSFSSLTQVKDPLQMPAHVTVTLFWAGGGGSLLLCNKSAACCLAPCQSCEIETWKPAMLAVTICKWNRFMAKPTMPSFYKWGGHLERMVCMAVFSFFWRYGDLCDFQRKRLLSTSHVKSLKWQDKQITSKHISRVLGMLCYYS